MSFYKNSYLFCINNKMVHINTWGVCVHVAGRSTAGILGVKGQIHCLIADSSHTTTRLTKKIVFVKNNPQKSLFNKKQIQVLNHITYISYNSFNSRYFFYSPNTKLIIWFLMSNINKIILLKCINQLLPVIFYVLKN